MTQTLSGAERNTHRMAHGSPVNTASDLFSGHVLNDVFSGTKPLDDAILFTNSGITALVELFLENFDADLSKVEILKLTKIPKTLFFSNKAKKFFQTKI